jgi:ribonucleoside-diphosphate reductase subunit M1
MLANKISVTELHKKTPSDIRLVAEKLYNFIDSCERPAPLLDKKVYDIIMQNADEINKRLDYTRDYNYDFFGFKTLEKAYLLRVQNKNVAERPQHLLMRVSIGIHLDDLESAFETYDLMSQLWFTHATPTLFNSGTP